MTSFDPRTAALVLLLALLQSGTIACETTGADSESDDDTPACELGSFTATSLLFEDGGCLDEVTRANSGVTVAFGTTFSWRVDAFANPLVAGVYDDTNSSANGRYEREGLEWVAFTGAIGGLPQGESTTTIDGVTDTAWTGSIDAVAVPGGANDSLDSVFVIVTVGD